MDADFVINLLTLGAPNVGKSQLIKRYLTQQFAEEYQPTGLEQLTMTIRVGTATAKMQIWDFGGRISLETEIGRKLIERGDIFLLCFNVADPASLETVRQTLSIVSPLRANAFVGLIGCKSDLREELEKQAQSALPTTESTGENKKNPETTDSTTPEPYASTPRPSSEPAEETAASTAATPAAPAAPATAATPNLGVPRDQALDVAAQADIPYFEVSAKTNSEVQSVFHTALIYAYKKHLSKKKTPQEEEQEQKEREKETAELRITLKSETPVFFSEFFSKDRTRSIFIDLFKTRDDDVINYLAHKDILPKFLEASLLDFSMPTIETRTFREFSVTALDNFYRLDSLFATAISNEPLLDSLFALFFERPKFTELPVPRKRYLIRFLSHLIDNYTKQFIEYAHTSKIVRRLTEIVEFDDVKEVFSVLLASEKKYVDKSGSSVDFSLLEKADIAEFLCSQLFSNRIGVVDNFFRVLTSVRGFSSEIIANIVKFQNFQICKNCLKVLVEDAASAFDVVVFFSEAILRVISLNESLQVPFTEVLTSSMSPIYSLLSKAAQDTTTTVTDANTSTTPTESSQPAPLTSTLHIHAILLLVDGLLRRVVSSAASSEIPALLKPLILDCLKIFFKVKFGNVLHFTVVGIIVTCFEQRHKDLIDILLKEGKLIDKILEFSDKRADPSVGYYGHLMMIAKYINECPLASEYFLENENWEKLMDSSVKEFFNKNICPPNSDLLAAKQRQIAKAGGSFLG